MVVNSVTVLYTWVEVVICQSDRSPERWMISQIPSIGGTSNQPRWEECEGNSPTFGMSLQNSSCSKWDVPDLPKL